MTDPTDQGIEPVARRVQCADGSAFELLMVVPPGGDGRAVYWMPAMGVPARAYLPLAQTLAGLGVSVALHEWRGIGSSDQRASRERDWGYRTLLQDDIPRGMAVARAQNPGAAWMLGGHSLGGQLAALYAALDPEAVSALLLVASGAPYWRQFPRAWRRLLWLAYAVAPWLARLLGHFPGSRLGFGGREARQLIGDWAFSGRSGRYAIESMQVELELGLAGLHCPVLALRMQDDRFGPEDALRYLLGKMPQAPSETFALDAARLGCRADHFSWMRTPRAVAAMLDQRTRWLVTQAPAAAHAPG